MPPDTLHAATRGETETRRRGPATARAAAALVPVALAAAWTLPQHGPIILAAALCAATAWLFLVALNVSRISASLAAAQGREAELVARNAGLLDAVAHYRDIAERQAQPIYRKDGAGRLTYANAAYRQIFGDPEAGDAVTGGPKRLAPEHPAEDGPSPDMRLMTTAGPRWFALDEQAIHDDAGRAVETQVTAHDVTERHLAEAEARRKRAEAEAAETAKSRLLAAVTHEVRTPIGGVVGMMDLLLDTGLRPEQQSYARSAHGSAAALLSLIDDLLDHASLEAGRLAMVERALSVEALVQEVCELLGPRADEKGLSIACFAARKLPPEILGDAARLRQVLLNLVGNAIKFTDHGGVVVEARPAAGRLEIAVRDTGRGVAAEDQDRIFGEFERAGGAASIAGNGLGLAISRRIVEAMGGALELKSRRGRGSVFTLSLPLKPAGAGEGPAAALLDQRFIVASGSSVTRRAVALALRDEGARVASFAKPRRVGEAILAGAGADGILVDLPMLERLDASLGGEPVVVMLAPSERERLPELRRRDGASYLIKPIRRCSLVARLTGAETDVATGPAAGETMPAAGGLRVLLAEDDEVTALIMRATIEKLGHTVERVTNGHEAISRSARAPGFDAILVDINMPGLGGAAAAAAIRNREARLGLPRVPVVAMSAGLTEAQARTATGAGIDVLLGKPVAADRLAACLDGLTRAPAVREEERAASRRLSQFFP